MENNITENILAICHFVLKIKSKIKSKAAN